MSLPAALEHRASLTVADLARCISCGHSITGDSHCPECGRAYPLNDGIIEAIGPLSGRNRIVAEFYDGPGWVKFRPWEQGFLMACGGVRKARMEILRHVLAQRKPRALVLEVGIGRGDNLVYLPPEWQVFGVDIARTQLDACLRRHPTMNGRLAWAEAEKLPFADATFDACWSVGGFNYYSDHETALREMRRVTRQGGPVVVADELPSLHRAGIGHLLHCPSFDAWWLRKLGLDRAFVEMVLKFNVDLKGLVDQVWPQLARYRIWHGMGYCLVNSCTS
jgi:ubiquinone/menaquinone biosynthesis C-methylase UbiE